MVRDDVLAIAQQEHSEVGTVISEVPDNWACGEQCFECNGCQVFHFGIRWNDTPNKLNVVTYGPKVISWNPTKYDTSRYECWAS